MDNMVKVYVNTSSYSSQITYINKSRINLIKVVKDSYCSYKYHIHISVCDCKETLDIVKDSKKTYWRAEKEAVEFIEKTFGNISTTESFESL